jgi:beta-lactamase regulating signal transducer with metallopeptidase domain
VIDDLGHVLAAWLVRANVSTAALALAALLVDRALAHRARASLRIALYAPVALRVLAPFSWSIPVAPSMPTLLPAETLAVSTAKATPAFASLALVVAYVAVAAALAIRALVRRRNLARALEAAVPREIAGATHPVLEHPELGPMVVGLAVPRIVLPSALLGDTTALACVLDHEASHVRRRDPWLAAFIELLLVVCWPVVPLWIAARRVRHLMELACDQAALADADASARRRYGHVLLDLAERWSDDAIAAGSLHFGSTLRARIESIAAHRRWPRAVEVALVTVAVAGFVACTAAAPAPAPSAEHPGALAPEAIQKVVRQSFGTYRQCYERGQTANPRLEGRVTVSFVIARDGSVRGAADHGSTLADADVVACVVRGFSALAFPPPDGGEVSVIYPIAFAPGDPESLDK